MSATIETPRTQKSPINGSKPVRWTVEVLHVDAAHIDKR